MCACLFLYYLYLYTRKIITCLGRGARGLLVVPRVHPAEPELGRTGVRPDVVLAVERLYTGVMCV